MSWDPNQPQGQPPSGPNPYDPQQVTPPQNPYQQPASGPNPQYTPPPQNPYEQPSGMGAFGAPGYQQQTAYGYAPAAAPLPLGQAIQGLPNQYIKILTKPGVQSFAEEQGKADWGIIWIQLLFLAVLSTIIALIGSAFGALTNPFSTSASSAASTSIIFAFAVGGSVFSFVTVPLFFFIGVGIQYLLAKAFKGTGEFKTQAYNHLLFMVPAAVIANIIGLIPILGGIVGFALYVYQVILNVFSIMAVHRLSGGKATMVVLIPLIVGFLLALLCVVVVFAAILAALHGASTTPTYP